MTTLKHKKLQEVIRELNDIELYAFAMNPEKRHKYIIKNNRIEVILN